MTAFPSTAPVLSTPDIHIFDDTAFPLGGAQREKLSDEQLEIRYEIDRTIAEIKKKKWSRVALQFPDEMLPDSANVYQLLARGLSPSRPRPVPKQSEMSGLAETTESMEIVDQKPVKLTILGDTSYGACCVDEIAAEHVDADAVIHYGRACLSPTARLPVLHVFTKRDLDYDAVTKAFSEVLPDRDAQIILTADVTYANHIEPVHTLLASMGYSNIFAALIIHDPSSPIPNRTVPESVSIDGAELQNYRLFHISDPPTSLLLTLSSRVRSVDIYSTNTSNVAPQLSTASTPALLRRRYALVTSLSIIPTWGILINTLSVSHYLSMITHVQSSIAAANKKSYLVVVGKLNTSKLANFAEVGGWVVIGCWESSLIDSKDFYAPVITPFELELALQRDEERVWTGKWRGDFAGMLEQGEGDVKSEEDGDGEYASEDESAPPEFDLRTGRYVSRSSPVALSQNRIRVAPSTALAKRATGDIATVNGVASPAAEFLRSKRTWQGLGSDVKIRYDEDEEGAAMQEGRSGTARGYTVGELERR
jgi:diphthamide biosynthesis protein 2